MIILKHQLKEGQKIKMIWRGKLYAGEIIGNPEKESKLSAKITRGRFISIPILTEQGYTRQMPYTSRARYEAIE